MEFRRHQAISDLAAAAHALSPGLVAQTPSALLPTLQRAPVEAQVLYGQKTQESLWRATAKPDDDGLAAGAIVLAFLLAGADDDLYRCANQVADLDDVLERRWSEATPAIRAAFAHGFLHGIDVVARASMSGEKGLEPVPEGMQLTKEPADLVPTLVTIARSMTMEERRCVASADYGDDVEKHLSALNAVLAAKDCRMEDHAEEISWFPGEVVELAAYSPSAPGFVACTALLLANALQSGTYVPPVGMDAFYSASARGYGTLAPDERHAIRSAYRYLYESDPYFEPDLREGSRSQPMPLIAWSPT
ncbi:MAG: hypothetical protein AAF698_01710 [Pseudomonadota bacterium]